VDEQGDPHSRPMSYNREIEFDGDLWFFTYGSSHKVDEVGRVPTVNASFADIVRRLSLQKPRSKSIFHRPPGPTSSRGKGGHQP
jgi:hypothetical protein